ncbi:hypothetical protein D3C83_173550 [compost metagenome]
MTDMAAAERLLLVVDAGERQTLGQLVAATPARDTSAYTATVATKLPNSTVFLLTRRDAK